MGFQSKYIAHTPNAEGFIHYSVEENAVWQRLYTRQMAILPGRACEAFMRGLACLDLGAESIPQIPDISKKLKQFTGWEVAPVAALISARDFFQLLAQKKFPAATFIRTMEELDYVQEPDIFHEIFGHCPMLTDTVYSEFICNYAKKVLTFPESEWALLQRLFWFTVEFGLIYHNGSLRAYGGGILSSIAETPYSIESDIPMRALFHPITAFRTPYRIDMPQRVYFVITSYQMLYHFVDQDWHLLLKRARELGESPPLFPIDPDNPNIHILAC